MVHGPNKTIYLQRSRYSKAFGPDESLWEDEIARMMALIRSHNKALFTQEGRHHQRNAEASFIAHDGKQPLLSIGIFGTYGSGKSSLLRTFRERVNEAADLESNRSGQAYLNAFALPVLEPNRLHRDDHFLYAFLAEVLEEDRKQQEFNSSKHGPDTQVLTNLQQSFQLVSEYLQAVDEKPKGQENDPLGLSLERLDRHHSALQLRRALSKFIDIMADELGHGSESLIILPVDDADMDLDHLRETLTSIRRYLLHPRLVPVLTFTGRLAEEHLRADYERRMMFSQDREEASKLKEASTELTVAEQLVLQYLHKVIPVRNRIRQGAAVSLLQRARYRDQTGEIQTEGEDDLVFDLLEKGSQLLFGQPQWLVQPIIRSPLRSSTLRRQLQILDALHAANVHLFLGKGEHGLSRFAQLKQPLSWGEIFEKATWSLLNVHRDVLKEYHLNLDDLYSWTPVGLRKVILRSIGKKPPARRRDLIRDWRYRSENRRAMMLSLLAANVFRPRMGNERPRGDNPSTIQSWPLIPDDERAETQNSKETERDKYERWASFPVEKGVIWFCDVWIGFYLPQILSFRQLELAQLQSSGKNENCLQEADQAFDWNGWTLRSGPVNAIRTAMDSGELSSTGMIFLDCVDFAKEVKNRVEKNRTLPTIKQPIDSAELKLSSSEQQAVADAWQGLLMQIWCVYGNETGGVWSAVSFWRGLSLMAQLFGMHMEFRESKRYTLGPLIGKSTLEVTEKDLQVHQVKLTENLATRVRYLVYQHLKTARVLSIPMGINRSQEPPELQMETFVVEPDPENPFAFWRFEKFDLALNSLVNRIVDWLELHDRQRERIQPMKPVEESELHTQGRKSERYQKRLEWKSDFVRRLHADNLLAIFWQELDHPRHFELTNSWTAADALRKWVRVLKRYWDCGKGYHETESPHFLGRNLTQSIMLACPFIEPFATAGTIEIQDIFINNQIMSNIFLEGPALPNSEPREDWEKWNQPFHRAMSQLETALERFSLNHQEDKARAPKDSAADVKKALNKCRDALRQLVADVTDQLGMNVKKVSERYDRKQLTDMMNWWEKKLDRAPVSTDDWKFTMRDSHKRPTLDEVIEFTDKAIRCHLTIIETSYETILKPAEYFNLKRARVPLYPVQKPPVHSSESVPAPEQEQN